MSTIDEVVIDNPAINWLIISLLLLHSQVREREIARTLNAFNSIKLSIVSAVCVCAADAILLLLQCIIHSHIYRVCVVDLYSLLCVISSRAAICFFLGNRLCVNKKPAGDRTRAHISLLN